MLYVEYCPLHAAVFDVHSRQPPWRGLAHSPGHSGPVPAYPLDWDGAGLGRLAAVRNAGRSDLRRRDERARFDQGHAGERGDLYGKPRKDEDW